jgi:uncharacterized membrane protein YoaK (UPF0700 family)
MQADLENVIRLFALIPLALGVLAIAAFWKVFTKAWQPGWAAIIPIYNIIVWLRIAGRPGWWIILLLIPIVNFVLAIVVSIDFARKFGKGAVFGLGLVFVGFIFYPILAWGSAQYSGA